MKRPDKLKNITQLSVRAVKSGGILYSGHANIRMKERKIVKPEVEYILCHGHHEIRKDQYNVEFGSWDYAIKGKTLDGRSLRIVIAVIDPNILIVTTIDLDQKDE